MFLLDLLSARGICLACTNDHRLSWEIKEEKTPVLTRPGRRMWVGGRDSATRREAHFTCCLKIDISRFLRFLPCSATPAALRSWKSPNAVRAPLCFPTYGESPAGHKTACLRGEGEMRRRRCVLCCDWRNGLRCLRRLLHQWWCYKESILPRPRAVYLMAFCNILPIYEHPLRRVAHVYL